MFRYHNQALPLIYYGHTLLGLRKQFFFSLKQLMKRFIGEPQTIKLREIHARFYDPIDIDECAISAHNCHGVAHCFNNPGSFSCECRKNYIGDGVSCEPVGKINVELQ